MRKLTENCCMSRHLGLCAIFLMKETTKTLCAFEELIGTSLQENKTNKIAKK